MRAPNRHRDGLGDHRRVDRQPGARPGRPARSARPPGHRRPGWAWVRSRLSSTGSRRPVRAFPAIAVRPPRAGPRSWPAARSARPRTASRAAGRPSPAPSPGRPGHRARPARPRTPPRSRGPLVKPLRLRVRALRGDLRGRLEPPVPRAAGFDRVSSVTVVLPVGRQVWLPPQWDLAGRPHHRVSRQGCDAVAWGGTSAGRPARRPPR